MEQRKHVAYKKDKVHRDVYTPCPLLYSNWFGLLNIMSRALEVPPDVWEFMKNEVTENEHKISRFHPEIKRDSFGMINGELVVIDYGDR